jgi:hypothetical protein
MMMMDRNVQGQHNRPQEPSFRSTNVLVGSHPGQSKGATIRALGFSADGWYGVRTHPATSDKASRIKLTDCHFCVFRLPKGGSEFLACPLPSSRLGSSCCVPAFPRPPSRNAIQAVGGIRHLSA